MRTKSSPKFSPRKSPMKARGAFPKPLNHVYAILIKAEFPSYIPAFVWSARDADAPEAAATTTVSPAAGLPISSSPM